MGTILVAGCVRPVGRSFRGEVAAKVSAMVAEETRGTPPEADARVDQQNAGEELRGREFNP
jgi:hypothetical protein